MRKLLFTIIIIIFALSNYASAQDNWKLSAGVKYPRFYSINTDPSNTNYGAFLSFQNNINKSFVGRISLEYSHMENDWFSPVSFDQTTKVDLLQSNFDLLFYIIPGSSISPYAYAGLGFFYSILDNQATAALDNNSFNIQINSGLGIEWCISQNIKILSEYGFYLTSDSKMDGAIGAGEAGGNDSYFAFKLGLIFSL